MKVDCLYQLTGLLQLLTTTMLLQLTQNSVVMADSRDVIMMEVLPPEASSKADTKATKKEQIPPTSSPTSTTHRMTKSTEAQHVLQTQPYGSTTPTTMPIPTIDYLAFLKIVEINNNSKTDKPNKDDGHVTGEMLLWFCLLAVGSFLAGMILVGFIAYGLYRRLGCRCRITSHSCHANHGSHCDLEAPAERQRSPPSGMESSEPLLRRNEEPKQINNNNCLPTMVASYVSPNNFTFPYSSFRGLDHPWVTQFHQLISRQYGGDVTYPHSDVIVSLPPESFHRYPHRPVYVNVAIGGDDFNLDLGSSDIQLTPVVEVTSVGIHQFSKPVKVRIPHRACVNDVSQWQMTLYYTTSPLGRSTSWHKQSQSTNLSDVSFTFDRNYVYVETTVPGTFICAGVGRKQATLCVCSVAYVNWQANSHHLQLSVYICDNYTDMHKYINDLEISRNGVRASHHQSLSVYNMKDWTIKLHSASSPVWPWAEVDEDYNQAISMNEIVRRPVGPSCVNFRLRCKDSNRPLEDFQATVTISQVRKDNSRSDNIYLVTRHVLFQEIPGFSLSGLRRKSVHEPEDESLC